MLDSPSPRTRLEPPEHDTRRRSRERALRLALLVVLVATGAAAVLRTYAYLATGVGRHRAETAALWFMVVALVPCIVAAARASRIPDSAIIGRAPAFAAGLVVLVLFWPALGVGLLSDDFVLLPTGAACGDRNWPFTRPLPLGIWAAADAALPRAWVPPVLHALNLLLHATNAVLVMWLGLLIGRPRRSAVFAGLLFASFPTTVEPVVWASGVHDVLLVTGVLLFATGLARRRSAEAALGLVMALMSKETAVAAPVLAAIVLLNRENWHRLGPRLGIALALCGAFAAWRLSAAPATGALHISGGYELKELLTRPFATVALPWRIDQLRAAPVAAAAWVTVILGAIGSIAVRARTLREPAGLVARGAAWIVAAVAPLGGMLFIDGQLEGSRYLYLPLVGYCLAFAAALDAIRSRASRVLMVVVLIVGTLGVRGHMRPWIDAAARRDAFLAGVRAELDQRPGTVEIRDVPDVVRGAFVFRNGLREAIARQAGCAEAARLHTVPPP